MKAIKFVGPAVAVETPRVTLKTKLEATWRTPEFRAIADAYRSAAGNKRVSGSFGACLRDKMEAGTGGMTSFAACAKDAGLGDKYAGQWG